MALLYTLPKQAVAGSVYISEKLDTTKDIVVSFDYACYGLGVSGSEGFSVFFINSFADSLVGGGPGPGLCYATTDGISAWTGSGYQSFYNGVFYGEIGVGFDLTGSFGTSGFGSAGGSMDPKPNTIAIRDSFNDKYNLLYRSENLTSTAYSVPLSLYQQASSCDALNFYRVRVRLTDFCSRVIVDIRHPNTLNFVNYVDTPIPGNRPPSFNCCLGFSSGLESTFFKIKNFNVNGFFTTLSGNAGTDIFTYIGESYLGLVPTPAELTVYDTISAVNAPPFDTGPILSTPLIIVSEGTAPLEAGDEYVLITPL
jgi:hypothetical protein